jgi:hypothetical protein
VTGAVLNVDKMLLESNGVSGTGAVGQVTIAGWTLVPDDQSAVWVDVNDAQSATWLPVDTST